MCNLTLLWQELSAAKAARESLEAALQQANDTVQAQAERLADMQVLESRCAQLQTQVTELVRPLGSTF
jgi:hypothetical protein